MNPGKKLVWIYLWFGQSVFCSENEINCFSQIDESKWGLVVQHNVSSSSLDIFISGAGPNVLTCLNGQHDQPYRISVSGDTNTQKYIHPMFHYWEGEAGRLVSISPSFTYIIYGGRYRVEFAKCNSTTCDQVFSDFINIQSEIQPWCNLQRFEENSTEIEISSPLVTRMQAFFQFSYTPCSDIKQYDSANVTLYKSSSEEDCEGDMVLQETINIERNEEGKADISYLSPDLEGDSFYCVTASSRHISCHLSSVDPPAHCFLKSDPVWIPALPAIALIIPFCTSHLACAWLYIVVAGSILLLMSLLLAVLCVRCCDRRTKHIQRKHDEVDFSGEVLNLTCLPERNTWAEIHAEWEKGEEKPRGKILLLYSPDTKLFKELQEALKSFLHLACHCDIYDLFDDALFDTIALDPSVWLEEFVNDVDVKIIIVSSIGAYRRQLALQGKMPLNLPENSLLDGLFTSGLRFVSTYPGLATSGRVATARYEMLHLTEEGHCLQPPIGGATNREYLVPTQLHELFCWIHHLQPLDVMGKPWVNYHLELQLLQDALKLVRRDRSMVGNGSGTGNGLTML